MAEKLDEGITALTPALSPAERVIHRRTSVDICLTVARILSSKFKNSVKKMHPLFPAQFLHLERTSAFAPGIDNGAVRFDTELPSMTFLPIVERELRVAARRRTTHRSRLLMAVAAMLIGLGVLLANFGATRAVMGKFFFTGLGVLALVYCLLAGRRSTADCLSEEKREGTLGLLFLTDLTGYDVVLGKLAATSLNAFYGLLAVFPVLALPLLMGGITNGEFWRLVVVLLDTFLFSLAVGIFASALSHDLRKAMAINFGVLLAFVLVIPACASAIDLNWHVMISGLLYSTPIYSFTLLFDQHYKTDARNFWCSVALIHGLTWLLLIQASRIVPHSWQDGPAPTPRAVKKQRQGFWQRWSYGDVAKRAPYRKKLLDLNAFYWLAARARLKPLHVWTFLFLIAGWCVFLHFVSSGIVDDAINTVAALLLNTTLKLWLTLEAGHRLAEDKKIGALELILSTPLGERELIRGQMLALRRQFQAPVIAVIIVDLILMKATLDFASHHDPQLGFLWLGSILMLPVDVIALAWVAMAKALTAKTYNQSIVATVGYILWLPWIIFGAGTLFTELWYYFTSLNGGAVGNPLHPGWFFFVSLLVDVFFAWRARRVLLGNLRYLAAQRFASPAAPEEFKPVAPKNRRRKLVLRWAFALAVIAVGVAYFASGSAHKFPPPVVVPISLSQGPLRIFASSQGAMFILPDGSLWAYGESGGAQPKAQMPQPVGTNHWLNVSTANGGFGGVRDDGTLWDSVRPSWDSRHRLGHYEVGELAPKAEGNDWASTSTSGWFGCALKRDGTLWAWGNNQFGQLGNGLGPNETNIVQVGTNTNWAAVCCTGSGVLALRTDGTLWAWGRAYFFRNYNGSMPNINNLAIPTQVCRETNWVEFSTAGMSAKVRNREGELWEPFYSAPSADLGAVATCRQASGSNAPNHIAFAYCGEPTAFEIHADGTLWEAAYDAGTTIVASPVKWRQVGKRSDWLSLSGGGGAAFSLTADGTLWTWGLDYTSDVPADFNAKLRVLRVQIAAAFGRAPPGMRMGLNRNSLWQYEKTPRAILRLGAATP